MKEERKDYHCVFWYPRIYHKELGSLISETERTDISDGAELSFKRWLQIKIDSITGDLTVLSFAGSGSPDDTFTIKNAEITLRKVYDSENGFVVYSYSLDFDKNRYTDRLFFEKKNFERLLKTEIYHLAKSFYHKHEINHTSDSSLKSYIYEGTDIKDLIFKLNHDPIIDYLNQFEELLNSSAKTISSQNNAYDELYKFYKLFENSNYKSSKEKLIDFINADTNKAKEFFISNDIQFEADMDERIIVNRRLLREVTNDKIRYKHLNAQLNAINHECEHASMSYTYCKTLLESKYNTTYKHTTKIAPCELYILNTFRRNNKLIPKEDIQYIINKDDNRKNAINIRNTIRYIECVKYKCSARATSEVDFYVNKLRRTEKRNTWFAILSIVLGLLSLGLAIVLNLPFNQSSNESLPITPAQTDSLKKEIEKNNLQTFL